MNSSTDESSAAVSPRRGGAGRRGFLWMLSSAPALSLVLSLIVHGGVLALLVVTPFGPRQTAPQILLPEGLAMAAEVRLVNRPVRQVAPPRPTPPDALPAVPLKIEPLPEPPIPEPSPTMDIVPEKVAETAETSPIAPPEPPTVAATPVATVVATEVKEPVAAPAGTPTRAAPPTPAAAPAAPTAPATPPVPASPAAPASDAGPNAAQGVRTGVGVAAWPTVRYPPSCRRRGEEGLVRLEVEVLADGRVGRITILQRADSPKLDEAAVEAVRQATFTPATVDGRPVAATVIVPVRFELR